jgi:hypothetical protein
MSDNLPPPARPDPLEDQKIKAMLAHSARRGMQTFWILIGIETLVVIALLGAVVYLLVAQAHATQNTDSIVAQAVQKDDKRWCATVDLFTLTPVAYPADPAANPSRVASYKLYMDFVSLKKEFSCG